MTLRFLSLFSVLFLAACSKPNGELSLEIVPEYSQQPISCSKGFLRDNNQWYYRELQLFISDFSLKDSAGKWHHPKLKKTAYQSGNVILIGESCTEQRSGGDPDNFANWQIHFADQLDLTNVKTLRFNIGVPFSTNHLNPLTQDSPLNISSMFWVWQTGHKFARIELLSENNDWVFHLGSTGCSAPSAIRSPTEPCKYPNRVSVELPVKEGINKLVLDLAVLLTEVDIIASQGCQSGHDDTECIQPMINIGLSKQVNERHSSIFSVR